MDEYIFLFLTRPIQNGAGKEEGEEKYARNLSTLETLFLQLGTGGSAR